jgi:hypothetical protein
MRTLSPIVSGVFGFLGTGLAFMVSQSPAAVPKALEPWAAAAGWSESAAWLGGRQAPVLIGGGLARFLMLVAVLGVVSFIYTALRPAGGARNLEIRAGDDGRFSVAKARSLYARERTLHLEIANRSSQTSVSGCKVRLVRCYPEDTGDGPWSLWPDPFSLPPEKAS